MAGPRAQQEPGEARRVRLETPSAHPDSTNTVSHSRGRRTSSRDGGPCWGPRAPRKEAWVLLTPEAGTGERRRRRGEKGGRGHRAIILPHLRAQARGGDFLATSPPAQRIKQKITQLHFIKIKHVCSSKTLKRTQKASHTLGGTLCQSHICTKHSQNTTITTKQQLRNGRRVLGDRSPKKTDIGTAKQHAETGGCRPSGKGKLNLRESHPAG